MSAVANIVISDALATPVAHTFIPLGPDASGTWWWEDQSNSQPLGYNRISAQLVRPAMPTRGQTAQDRVNRVKVKILTPQLENLGNSDIGITPPPTVAYVPYAEVTFVASDRASTQVRKDLRKYMYQLCNEAQVVAMFEALQGVY